MSSKNKKDLSPKVKAAIGEVLKQFETGDLSPIVQRSLMIMPSTLPASAWTFSNATLAYMSTKFNADCRGFQQWKAVDRKVKKGEKSGYIFRPKTIKTGELDAEGEEKIQVIGFQPIPIFGLDQTEGEDLPADQTPAIKEPPNLADAAKRLGVTVKYDWYPHDQSGGMFVEHSGKKEIHLYTDSENTWWHELAHAAHCSIDDEFYQRSSTEQETVAEFTAAVIAQLYGRPTSGESYRYIEALHVNPVAGIMKSLKMIEEVLQVIGV